MKLVIFACVHNAGRSQMAAALFNRHVRGGAARAISAGTNPGDAVYPEVIQVMAAQRARYHAVFVSPRHCSLGTQSALGLSRVSGHRATDRPGSRMHDERPVGTIAEQSAAEARA